MTNIISAYSILVIISLLMCLNHQGIVQGECDSDAVSLPKAYHRDQLKSVYWMHIQKTSSWMGNLIALWACPEFCRYYVQKKFPNEKSFTSLHDKLMTVNYIDGAMSIIKINNNNTVNNNNHHKPKMIDHRRYEYHAHELPHNFNFQNPSGMLRSYLMNCSVNFDGFNQGYGWHQPLCSDVMRPLTMTLFRKPSSRVISAFLFEIMFPAGTTYRSNPSVYKKIRDTIVNSDCPVCTYARVDGISSCQTKMVLGYFCGENVTLSQGNLMMAKQILRKLFFFGLTEEPIASVNLFLAMYGKDGARPNITNIGHFIDPPFVFTSTRSNVKHSRDAHAELLRNLTGSGWKDSFDEELYAEATKIFYNRCKRHGIETVFQSIDQLMNHLHM